MNASYEWLRAFIPIDATPSELRDLLTTHTAVVEDLVPLRSDLAPIVVARVTKAARHPDSDHLWVTTVDAGDSKQVEVVCGAPNVIAGRLYPFAHVGTTMPNGMKIERRQIRGVVSHGMLCSARELGMGDDQDGILELRLNAAPGTPLLSVMPVGDIRLVIDVGANRPDLLSHLGLARELTAITGTQWQLPDIPNLAAEIAKPRRAAAKGAVAGMEVRVDETSNTRRYIGAVVRGVQIGPSPEWLVRRLEAVGVRSINNVVDATNYVLHELGQPVHAFDLDKLAGSIVVRRARSNEQLVTLDGITRELPADAVVIADSTGAQAVAGIMGGRESEVTATTRDLFIEVASFDPKLTRTARRGLRLSTDASYRFERGVVPELGPLAVDRVIRIVIALAGGAVPEAPIDLLRVAPSQVELTLRSARVRQVLGTDISTEQSARHLAAAGFQIMHKSVSELRTRVPTWRSDVQGEIDLVEEVARFHGYDKLPDEIRAFRPTTTRDEPIWLQSNRVRETMVGLGLLEVRPMPFVRGTERTHVRVHNPVAENEAFLRHSLLETLAGRAEYNLSQRVGDVRIFEVGSAYSPGKSALPREQVRLGAIIMGRRRPPHFTEPQPPVFDEWDAKAIAKVAAKRAHPESVAELVAGTNNVLWNVRIGEHTIGHVVRMVLDAPVWAAPAYGIEIILADMDTAQPAEHGAHTYLDGEPPRPRAVRRYRTLPTMPTAEIDLALLVPHGTTVADVERVIRAAAGPLLEQLALFDQYTGAGVAPEYRSLAWRLTFRHPDRTLRDKEIEARRRTILAALEQELHVQHRTA